MFLRLFCSTLFITIIIRALYAKAVNPKEWEIVESLAEEHPYIVALLNVSKDYTCTGTTIGRRTVLTSGYCTSPEPAYVAVGLAVYTKKYQTKNILDVAYTQLHDDYTYIMKATEPNVTRMHSNIGLVFVVRPLLSMFLPPAPIGSYYASELGNVELRSVGYGGRYGENLIVLQHQCYDPATCANPRWYYCICGIEVPSAIRTYEKDFGNGAPVLYGNDVVGITATATGVLTVRSTGVKYNIFTVIGPYIPWIEKTETSTMLLVIRARNEARHNYDLRLLHTVYLFLFTCIMYKN